MVKDIASGPFKESEAIAKVTSLALRCSMCVGIPAPSTCNFSCHLATLEKTAGYRIEVTRLISQKHLTAEVLGRNRMSSESATVFFHEMTIPVDRCFCILQEIKTLFHVTMNPSVRNKYKDIASSLISCQPSIHGSYPLQGMQRSRIVSKKSIRYAVQ